MSRAPASAARTDRARLPAGPAMIQTLRQFADSAWSDVRRRLAVRRTLHITREGVVFIGLILCVGLAAINTGANLLYMFFSMMAALMILSAFASWSNLRDVEVRRRLPDGVFAGEAAAIRFEARNRKRLLNSYSLRMVDFAPDGTAIGAACALRLPRNGVTQTAYEIRVKRRGRFTFDRIAVASRYPFSFNEKGRSWPAPQDLLVFPRLYPAAGFLERQEMDWGALELPRRGHGAGLHALRDYTLADSAKLIHWKVSARAATLIVRELEAEDELKASLILDNCVEQEDLARLDDSFERAVSCLASVARELLERGFQIEVITREGRLPFGEGQSHLRRILEAMALIELRSGPEPPPSLRLPDPESFPLWLEYGGGLLSPAGQAFPMRRLQTAEWPPSGEWPSNGGEAPT